MDARGTLRGGAAAAAVLVAVAVVALVPRWRLAADIEPGQPQWTLRAERFWQAFAEGRLESTYLAPHPGLTVLWIGGAAIAAGDGETFVERMTIASRAVGVASVVALLACLVYLGRRDAGEGVAGGWAAAGVVGLAVALDPVMLLTTGLAGLDGLFALLVLLALLAIFDHADHGGAARLVAAAAATGAAVATKGPGLLLLVVPLLLRWRPLAGPAGPARGRSVGRTTLALAVGTAAVVAALLPAAWVAPLGVAERLLWGGGGETESLARVLVEGRENYLFGANAEHAGPLLYLVNLVVRATPLALLGGLAGLASRRFRRDRLARRLAAFGALLLLVLVAAQQKEWRYIVPLLALLDVLGALGLVAAARAVASSPRLAARWGGRRGTAFGAAAAALLVAAQGAWVLAAHPFYELRTNPLLGPPRVAARWVQLGWTGGWLDVHRFLAARSEALGRPIVYSGGSPKFALYEQGAAATERVVWVPPEGWRRADCHAVHLYHRMFGLREGDRAWLSRGRSALRVEPYGLLLVELRCRHAVLRDRRPARARSAGVS